MKRKTIFLLNILTLCFSLGVDGYNTYMFDDVKTSFHDPHIVTFGGRVKRDAPTQTAPVEPSASPPPHEVETLSANNASDSNKTNKVTATSPTAETAQTTTPAAAVTQIPLLGQNGTGIFKNATNTPRVSEPISADDNITNDLMDIDITQKLKAEHNLSKVVEDNHSFYNSSFIGNVTYFNEYWANISKQDPKIHSVLSNSHRRATTLRLSFDFPFYGHPLRNITVATGGFIYTGEHVHNWLAATQYIAPLMANFDTTLTNDSYVKMYDDGEKFTAFWENVTLQEDLSSKFTFAVTLNKNGDIVFAYKSIPLPVQNISDSEHPVKVGISDAYLNDRIVFLVRRKTIYEYHRVSFKNYEIKNNTILKLTALPTCLQYNSCESCVNHDTGFDCMWCEAIQKCSSGTDRNKQDWLLRNCERNQISNASMCSAPTHVSASDEGSNTAYSTDTQIPYHVADVHNLPAPSSPQPAPASGLQPASVRSEAAPAHSGIGGAVAAFAAVALVAAAGVWVLYAFKNPHTRSGQLLIKYRPSQWSWRRGEARYTAATIHM